MKMLKSKKGFVWIPVLVIVGVIILFVIIGNFGSFTIFGKEYYFISPQFQSEFRFWELVLVWIVLQVAVVFGYYKLFEISKIYYGSIKQRFDKIIAHFKQIFK